MFTFVFVGKTVDTQSLCDQDVGQLQPATMTSRSSCNNNAKYFTSHRLQNRLYNRFMESQSMINPIYEVIVFWF